MGKKAKPMPLRFSDNFGNRLTKIFGEPSKIRKDSTGIWQMCYEFDTAAGFDFFADKQLYLEFGGSHLPLTQESILPSTSARGWLPYAGRFEPVVNSKIGKKRKLGLEWIKHNLADPENRGYLIVWWGNGIDRANYEDIEVQPYHVGIALVDSVKDLFVCLIPSSDHYFHQSKPFALTLDERQLWGDLLENNSTGPIPK